MLRNEKNYKYFIVFLKTIQHAEGLLIKVDCASINKECMYSSDELFQSSWEGYFGVYCPSCEATRAINTKITLDQAQKQFIRRVHTLFYFLHDITNPSMTIFTHHPHVSLARFSFCWWCHNWMLITSQWPDNYDAITWIVILNLLDIDFIHGDIHGRSCKKFDHIG